MKRFFNNEPEPEGDDFSEYEDEEDQEEGAALQQEITAYVDREDLLSAMQIDLAQMELNQDLLTRAIDIASQSVFWSFKKPQQKLEEIERIYKRLHKLTQESQEGSDEDASL